MKQLPIVFFVDQASKCEACAIVCRDERGIGLALSITPDSDVEVFMPLEDAQRLIESLREALASATF